MGLMIHSLELLSKNVDREYFIYLLDYGWDEPLANTLRSNFAKMADFASKNEAAIIIGVGDVGHFDNEVLSWHQVNGENARDLLPGILITTTNPHKFREFSDGGIRGIDDDFKFILIPLKKICNNATDVASLIQKIFHDIQDKKELSKFSVMKNLKRNIGRRIVDSIILQPNISGVGVNLKKLFERQ